MQPSTYVVYTIVIFNFKYIESVKTIINDYHNMGCQILAILQMHNARQIHRR